MVDPPPKIPETIKIKTALREQMRIWKEGAEIVDRKSMSLRMTKASLDVYRRHLEKAVNLASVYGDSEADRQESAIYSINTLIYRFFPKD